MKAEIELCTGCKKPLKMISGKGVHVYAWKLYCEECYDKGVEKGRIIPPSHYKVKAKKDEKDIQVYVEKE